MKKHLALIVPVLLSLMPSAQSQICLLGDCLNGFGGYAFENGDEYVGEWKNGQRTGVGCYDWVWGAYYYGEFVEGRLEGRGYYVDTLISGANDKIGYFSNNQLKTSEVLPSEGCVLGNCTNGVGVYQWGNGDVFIGMWVNGVRTGLGRFDQADGSLYIGDFVDNLMDGYGDYFPVNGELQSGYFEKGIYIGDGLNEEYYDDYDY